MQPTMFLLECLLRAGMRDVVAVEPVAGGIAALAGMATRRDAPPVFVKAFADAPADDVFVAEAEGLAALRELGGVATPEVILARPRTVGVVGVAAEAAQRDVLGAVGARARPPAHEYDPSSLRMAPR